MLRVIIMQMIKSRLVGCCIGPGKAIDTNHFFIVSLNNIGGCNGSTGPTSPNPENENRPYGPDFPLVTVRDWVKTKPCCLIASELMFGMP